MASWWDIILFYCSVLPLLTAYTKPLQQFKNVSPIRIVCVRLPALHLTCTGKTILLSGNNVIMLNRFFFCMKYSSIFCILPSNRKHWWGSTMNWRYSRCTDWKFYTWFHLNSTNGYIIAPFHHFPLLGDIKGNSLRERNKDEYIQLGTWALLKSDHAYFYLSFCLSTEKKALPWFSYH